MADLTEIQTATPVFLSDSSTLAADLRTTTPGASDVALVVREAQRGQQTSANSIPVVIASDQSISISANDNKAEDSVHVSGDTGSFALAVRNDAGTALAADGDYIPFTTDSNGNLRVAASVTINAERAEDSVHTTGDTGSFILAVRNDAAAARTSADGDYSPISVDSAGRLYVADGGGSITIDGTVTLNSDKVEDAAHTTGDTGSFILGVRNDALAARTGTDGDYSPISTDDVGRVLARCSGDVAHDTADSGNPVKIGGQARTTNPTAVADSDRSNVITDDVGRLIVVQGHCRDRITRQRTQITSTTETTFLTAGGSGVFLDITMLVITNTGGTTTITLRDGTAGTTILSLPMSTNDYIVMPFNPPMPQTTANNNWTAQLSSSNTVNILAIAVQNV